jgi:LysR family transcriptional regulator, glycine cleavage system transcriptional activator
MSRKLPSFPALAAFEAVARYQSFAKAAEELNISQSAVSHRIRTLEEQFGVPFFLRNGRSIALTTQGTAFLGAAIQALATLEQACVNLGQPARTVKLSVGPAFARNWLVGRLGGFSAAHPGMDVDINASKLAQTGKLAALRTGEADVAIRYGLESDWAGFQVIELMRSETFPVCSPAYRDKLQIDDGVQSLLTATLLRSPRVPWQPWFDAAGLTHGAPTFGSQFSDAALMLDAAADGQGVALARSALVENDLANGRLVRLFEVSVTSELAYHAVYRREITERPEVSAFLTWLVDAATREAKLRKAA